MGLRNIQDQLREHLLDLDRESAVCLAKRIAEEKGIYEFADRVLMMVLKEVGDLWQHDQISLCQLYVSGKICEEIVNELMQQNQKGNIKNSNHRIAIVSIEPHHVLGKRIVSMVLSCHGFDLIDYGYGIAPDALIEKVIEEQVDILLISVLMYPSALKVKEIRQKLTARNKEVKILVGGAPFLFDDQLWEQVGADAMGKSAREAIDILDTWMREE